jgi:small nuclear ribonucleoprotein (snRNP)-like protein
MSNYIGYKVRIFMQNNATFQGTIAFVDNQLIKLKNGFTTI